MQLSATLMRVNEVWDRVEKSLYAVIDLSLNLYFLYLVRTRLLSVGMKKYRVLFWGNAAIVWVSIAMDVS